MLADAEDFNLAYVYAHQSLAIANEGNMWNSLPGPQVMQMIADVRTFAAAYESQMSPFMVSILNVMADMTEARVWMKSDKSKAGELYDRAIATLNETSGGQDLVSRVQMERMFAEEF